MKNEAWTHKKIKEIQKELREHKERKVEPDPRHDPISITHYAIDSYMHGILEGRIQGLRLVLGEPLTPELTTEGAQ